MNFMEWVDIIQEPIDLILSELDGFLRFFFRSGDRKVACFSRTLADKLGSVKSVDSALFKIVLESRDKN